MTKDQAIIDALVFGVALCAIAMRQKVNHGDGVFGEAKIEADAISTTVLERFRNNEAKVDG